MVVALMTAIMLLLANVQVSRKLVFEMTVIMVLM